ncbi:MAG TPA: zinc ribbon domain-containing protein [Candidatus Acidoferrales bacterium]|nr:zinc ribbon domain-containing protein [Candidatus Acidoferrales bacterium]
MPTYEYRCLNCKRKFTVMVSISEHDAKKVKCPKCGSRRINQLITSFYAQTSSKS